MKNIKIENYTTDPKDTSLQGVLMAIVFGFKLVWKAGPLLFTCLCMMTMLQGFAPAVTIWISKQVLDAIVEAVRTQGNWAQVLIVYHLILLQLSFLVLVLIVDRISEYLHMLMGQSLRLSTTSDVMRKLSTLDLVFFEEPHLYDMLVRAKGEAEAKPLTLLDRVCSIIRVAITFISMSIVIIDFNLIIFAVMVLLCIPYFITITRLSKISFQIQYERTHDARLASYFSTVIADKRYIPEIISFGLWNFLLQKWLFLTKRFIKQDISLAKRITLAQTVIEMILHGGKTAVTAYILYIGVTKMPRLTVGEIMMYIGAFIGGLNALGSVLEKISGTYEAALFLQNLIKFHKIIPFIETSQKGLPIPNYIESIEIQNVSFKYPGREEYALRNINASFRRSESVLVVGCNGAGKTTLIKLLARLYDPDEGKILLNGIDLREYDLASLRKNIGVVFQDFIRYALPAKENIGCGNLEALGNDEMIIRSAQSARADEFIRNLPLGYDTVLSKEFKDGQDLSTGQWQRICIARLFMKNAPLIMLDEPTASVDVESEAYLLHEIASMSANKICILVSHRIFRKDIAKHILVLENGEVVEQGSYEELVNSNGRFAELSRLYHGSTVL